MVYNPFAKASPRGYQHDTNRYDRRIRLTARPKPANGATGTTRNTREGSTLADQRHQDKAVRDFVESLAGADRDFAEAIGLSKPLADPFPRREAAGDSDSDREREPLHADDRGSHNGKPLYHGENNVIDALEPQRSNVSIEELSEDEIAEAHDAFGRAIQWVHGHALLMKKARRLATLICHVRPDLADSLPHCPLLQRDLEAQLDFDPARLALVFGRVFAWCRDVATLSALGIRASIIAYVIRPHLLDAATNAQIGQPMNNTRAAINKLVQEFRDTFAGIRAPAMRGELTRTRCRQAQLA